MKFTFQAAMCAVFGHKVVGPDEVGCRLCTRCKRVFPPTPERMFWEQTEDMLDQHYERAELRRKARAAREYLEGLKRAEGAP